MENNNNRDDGRQDRSSQHLDSQNWGAVNNGNENRNTMSRSPEDDGDANASGFDSGTNPDRYTAGSDFENKDRNAGFGRAGEAGERTAKDDSTDQDDMQ